ncbi:hypothetical protein LTR66_013441 [Elasticomyces elasticus]|nr:hypothetical protein LTR66_013441 [Elasticomyces elasticus]
MAVAPASPKRYPVYSPGRAPNSEPPHKRRKYVPGGPGGGGRFIDKEGNKESIIGAGLRDDSIIAPRGRVALENVESGAIPATPSARRSPAMSRTAQSASRTATYPRPRRDRDGQRNRDLRRSVPEKRRYSSAAAAAAASQQNDGYKPREERSWEEFHPDLNISAALLVLIADEVDGRSTKDDARKSRAMQREDTEGGGENDAVDAKGATPPTELGVERVKTPTPGGDAVNEQIKAVTLTPRRRPGRPPRRPESMLNGLGSPPAPRIVPLPTHNPKERLNLPKPSFRRIDPFAHYEQARSVQVNYVDRTLANVGYQESDEFQQPQQTLIRLNEGLFDEDMETGITLASDEQPEQASAPAVGTVEYDMDEQDEKWLETLNLHRREEQVEAIRPAYFEITMTQIEKAYHALEKSQCLMNTAKPRIPKPNPRPPQISRPRSSSAAAVNGEPVAPGEEQDIKCAICDDGDCENTNAIVFCDGCDLAVHQECYGVPFIPEGNWLCRKCQQCGRGSPTCIFCPNVDGAFKQTNTLRWSHLLCAIWIPEVTIANNTFMEPIQDVEKVPKPRWKLNCYICHQKMGACIQCGNKNCYQAFHVTCARRAQLFLKMKSHHGGPGSLDASVLKAYCDRHVPPEWRRDHDVESATSEAKRFYRHHLKNKQWGDSQTAALTLNAPHHGSGNDMIDELAPADDGSNAIAGQKRKRNQPTKTGWRLPSGAPVVPHVIFEAVEQSLARFTIRKRKEYVAEACKYWTLKREARRGAALLKRLQLQMESFSSMEVTRRNFAGMGAVGRPRLLRRIEFAELLQDDMAKLVQLSSSVKQRELMKLQDLENLKELVDTVYFPITPLLWPILRRAQKLDEKTKIFKKGLATLEQKLSDRFYVSVSTFSADFVSVISSALGLSDIATAADMHEHLNEVPAGTAEHLQLSQEQKDLKRLAKRIVKAVKEQLEDATKKEAELSGRPYEKELKELDALFENAASRRGSGAIRTEDGGDGPTSSTPSVQYHDLDGNGDVSMADAAHATQLKSPTSADAETLYEHTDEAVIHLQLSTSGPTVPIPSIRKSDSAVSTPQDPSARAADTAHPLTPPISHASASVISAADRAAPLAQGGIPWYLEPFDPMGTTIHDERWTGREVLRGMSEELSEIGEEELQSMVVDDEAEAALAGTDNAEKAEKVGIDGGGGGGGGGGNAELEREETEEEKAAREKREKVNAKRRATRRKNRW